MSDARWLELVPGVELHPVSVASAARLDTSRREAPLFVAALSCTAASIHAAVAIPHMEEYALYGVLFALLAIAQVVQGVQIYRRPTVGWLASAIALNVGVLSVWALSRTTGLTVGASPGVAEPIGWPDVGATLAEVAPIGLATAGLITLRRKAIWTLSIWARQLALTALILGGLGLLSAAHAHP